MPDNENGFELSLPMYALTMGGCALTMMGEDGPVMPLFMDGDSLKTFLDRSRADHPIPPLAVIIQSPTELRDYLLRLKPQSGGYKLETAIIDPLDYEASIVTLISFQELLFCCPPA
jgi:hypothetical protein